MNTAFKALQLKARHQGYTLLNGKNFSKLQGEGYDFFELREYQVGDDIRKINWIITAKLGKPYIKELHSDREISIVVATLMDGSFYFGTGKHKQAKLTEVASTLAYATQKNEDLFTGISYIQNKTISTPPTKQLYHIEEFSKTLYDASLLGTVLDINISLQDLFKRVHKPSLIFVIGDFLEYVDLSLLAQKHEVIAIIVRDKAEEAPVKLKEITLLNPRNNNEMETYFGKKSIQQYLTRLKENDKNLIQHFTNHDIRHVKISTDEGIVERLVSLFSKIP